MKKTLAILLAVMMLAVMLPVTAMAADLPAVDGGKITLTSGSYEVSGDVTLAAGEYIDIPSGATVTLTVNGTITGVDNSAGSFALIKMNSGSTLTVTGSGTISLSATNNRGWGAYSSTISNNQGTLYVNGCTIEHTGGTDMAYAIDTLTNSGIGPAYLEVNSPAVVESPYRAIRMFANCTACTNTVVINGGTITGVSAGIVLQDSNSSVNLASLTINEGSITGSTRSVYVDNEIGGGSGAGLEVDLDGGKYTGPVVVDKAAAAGDIDTVISGGSYDQAPPAEYLDPSVNVVEDENGSQYVGSTADEVLQNASEGDTFTAVQGTNFDIPAGTTLNNATGGDITVNNNTVANGDNITTRPAPRPYYEEGVSDVIYVNPAEDPNYVAPTTSEKNPATGANDMVGAAVALAVVSALGMAVISKK